METAGFCKTIPWFLDRGNGNLKNLPFAFWFESKQRMHSSKTLLLHSLPCKNREWKQRKSKKCPPASLKRGNANWQNLSNAFPRACSEGKGASPIRLVGRAQATWRATESRGSWANGCREAKEHSKGRWRESKSARSGSFADRADDLRDKFSAFREFLILRWLFFSKSQCKKQNRVKALTILLKESVLFEKSKFCTDYSSEKVSAFREKWVLRWQLYPKSQCKR